MSEYRLKNGKILTDEQIEKECNEYESGTWVGHLENIRVGRPSLSTSGSCPITFKCGIDDTNRIERAAKIAGVNRSSFIRSAALEKAEKVLQEA